MSASTVGQPSRVDDERRRHVEAMPMIVGDRHSFPSHAELARTLIGPGALASVATVTESGHPYTSIVPISTVDAGAPVVCVSQLAEHTINLRRDPRASVLVHAAHDALRDPLALPRITLVGSFVPFDPDADTVATHTALHPHSRAYLDFPDFEWWRFELLHARFVGGFGVMGWVSAEEYAAAQPDPVIPAAQPVIDYLNGDHSDACLEIVRHLGGCPNAPTATVTGLDRYGVTLEVRDYVDPTYSITTVSAISRVAFDPVVGRPEDVRAATVALAARAREVAATVTDTERTTP
ncbi:MAG: DUF2470 domain-containing protein [Actinomycetota bacterium]